jgi:hypothetical protein
MPWADAMTLAAHATAMALPRTVRLLFFIAWSLIRLLAHGLRTLRTFRWLVFDFIRKHRNPKSLAAIGSQLVMTAR